MQHSPISGPQHWNWSRSTCAVQREPETKGVKRSPLHIRHSGSQSHYPAEPRSPSFWCTPSEFEQDSLNAQPHRILVELHPSADTGFWCGSTNHENGKLIALTGRPPQKSVECLNIMHPGYLLIRCAALSGMVGYLPLQSIDDLFVIYRSIWSIRISSTVVGGLR